MESTTALLSTASELYARADPNPAKPDRPPVYKAIGISLAIASGAFIGTSFVLKKIGLLRANVKYNEEAGEGYGYLKNTFWWTGMTLMIIGEICNFVAYAFVDAILVTPLGALSVVITTILSAIFLKERLSFVGKVGCFMCIIGSVVIVMNAPSQSSAATIQDMKHFVIAPGFLTYAGLVVAGCTFVALWAGPRYGKKSMLVYLSICSLIGGLSVVATQGLGAAVVAQAGGKAQFNQWFLYVLLVFVVATLVTEIIFLNKALNLFNAALVTPTYYVFFTSSTIVTSAILFRGFKGTPTSTITVVMGFLQICSGVILLQLSKSAKDVPDAALFKGDLDQVRTVAEQEEPESEPKADAIRGAAAIIRRLSNSRQKAEAAEAKRVHEEKLKDQMEPIGENEQVEWDGLRRRKTTISGPGQNLQTRKTLHPPLGMAHFPDDEGEDAWPGPNDTDVHGGFPGGLMNSIRRRAQTTLFRGQSKTPGTVSEPGTSPTNRVAMMEIPPPGYMGDNNPARTRLASISGGAPEGSHVFGLPQGLHRAEEDEATDSSQLSQVDQYGKPISWAETVEHENARPKGSLAPNPPPHTTKRQYSFQNVFNRHKNDASIDSSHSARPSSRIGLGSRQGSKDHNRSSINKSATEEERLGLVKGDSAAMLPLPDYTSEEEDWQLEGRQIDGKSSSAPRLIPEEKEIEVFETQRQRRDRGARDSTLEDSAPSAKQGTGGDETQLQREPKEWEGRASRGGAFI